MADKKCLNGWRVAWIVIVGILLTLIGLLLGCFWFDPLWWSQVGNWLVFVFMVIVQLAAVVCIERARFEPLQGKFLRIFKTHSLIPRRKNVLKAAGGAFLVLSLALFLGIIATILVDSSYTAWQYFMSLLRGIYKLASLTPNQENTLSVLAFFMWITEAAFLGFIVTGVVNRIGLDKRE